MFRCSTRSGGTVSGLVTSWSRGETNCGPVARLDWDEGQMRDVCMSSPRDEKGAFRVEASARTITKEPF